MKRIAVIGCSQSEFAQASGRPWSVYMAEEFNVHVDNWALSGKGHLWFDLVLKHIIINKIHYDAIIVQFASLGRWFIPVDGAPYLDFSSVIEPKDISDNYRVMFSNGHPGNCIDCMSSIKNMEIYLKNSDTKLKFDPVCYPHSYNEYFMKTIHLYDRYFENIFTFRWLEDVILPLKKHHGLKDRINELTYPERGDIGHFNPKGTRLVYDHIIMPGEIGDWLKSTCRK